MKGEHERAENPSSVFCFTLGVDEGASLLLERIWCSGQSCSHTLSLKTIPLEISHQKSTNTSKENNLVVTAGLQSRQPARSQRICKYCFIAHATGYAPASQWWINVASLPSSPFCPASSQLMLTGRLRLKKQELLFVRIMLENLVSCLLDFRAHNLKCWGTCKNKQGNGISSLGFPSQMLNLYMPSKWKSVK